MSESGTYAKPKSASKKPKSESPMLPSVSHHNALSPGSVASSTGILSMRSRAKTPPRYLGSISSGGLSTPKSEKKLKSSASSPSAPAAEAPDKKKIRSITNEVEETLRERSARLNRLPLLSRDGPPDAPKHMSSAHTSSSNHGWSKFPTRASGETSYGAELSRQARRFPSPASTETKLNRYEWRTQRDRSR